MAEDKTPQQDPSPLKAFKVIVDDRFCVCSDLCPHCGKLKRPVFTVPSPWSPPLWHPPWIVPVGMTSQTGAP